MRSKEHYLCHPWLGSRVLAGSPSTPYQEVSVLSQGKICGNAVPLGICQLPCTQFRHFHKQFLLLLRFPSQLRFSTFFYKVSELARSTSSLCMPWQCFSNTIPHHSLLPKIVIAASQQQDTGWTWQYQDMPQPRALQILACESYQ